MTAPATPAFLPAPTRGQKAAADLSALLRARVALVWISTREEARAEAGIIDAARAARYPVRLWDCAQGLQDAAGATIDASLTDPTAVLRRIAQDTTRALYVLRDLHRWPDAVTLRTLRNVARMLPTLPPAEGRAVVVVAPTSDLPPEVAACATVLDWPLPDRAEVAAILTDVLAAQPEDVQRAAAPNGIRDAATDAAVGLTAEEAASAYAGSLVRLRRIDPATIAQEKRRTVGRERVLTWTDPDPRGLDAVGGLDALKSWLQSRKASWSPKARAYGLPAPKGCLLLGPPGTGKSLTARCIASAWGMPLLRLDMGALRSKYVGESEGNIRKALALAETVSPCVLWLDEIEKALAGASGPAGDGGVSADALGSVLTWMQERQGSVFVVATANEVRSLPPELLRAGRFDAVWWIDLPSSREREAILAASLKQYARDPAGFDLGALAAATDGYSGAELAASVPEALAVSFADGARQLVTQDLQRALAAIVPLSRTARERIEELRTWARGKARPASTPETVATGAGRRLDI